MWETISDLNVHVQVAKASIFFRRYTLRSQDFAKNWDWTHSFGTFLFLFSFAN
jgi:hypothetical protein